MWCPSILHPHLYVGTLVEDPSLESVIQVPFPPNFFPSSPLVSFFLVTINSVLYLPKQEVFLLPLFIPWLWHSCLFSYGIFYLISPIMVVFPDPSSLAEPSLPDAQVSCTAAAWPAGHTLEFSHLSRLSSSYLPLLS